MPYIKEHERTGINNKIADAGFGVPVGELNYTITCIVHNWLISWGINYHNLNAAIGVLECAKQELYRKVVAPYEEIKIKENGPISGLDSEK